MGRQDLAPEKDEKKEHKKDKGDDTSKSLVGMMMGGGQPEKAHVVDSETLVAQTQDRLWRALKRRYQYDSSLKPGQDYLLEHVSSKIPLVIMYADLVGSTNMSMTLPVDKLVTIIRSFTQEMSSVVESNNGLVLKYVGDALNRVLSGQLQPACRMRQGSPVRPVHDNRRKERHKPHSQPVRLSRAGSKDRHGRGGERHRAVRP
ncbi:hypothetical protein [Candidatus Nitrososphaera sp. FF02]|uniref:hypothetical protein n=1 Tax=Candidatus Nitrososphaera sp. FF02 TaxID=3398226 RepID=UPI0039E7DF4D